MTLGFPEGSERRGTYIYEKYTLWGWNLCSPPPKLLSARGRSRLEIMPRVHWHIAVILINQGLNIKSSSTFNSWGKSKMIHAYFQELIYVWVALFLQVNMAQLWLWCCISWMFFCRRLQINDEIIACIAAHVWRCINLCYILDNYSQILTHRYRNKAVVYSTTPGYMRFHFPPHLLLWTGS